MKEILNKSFRQLDSEIKMKDAAYKNMKATLRKVEKRLRDEGFTFDSKRIGGAKLRLGVNYTDKAFDVDSALIFNGKNLEETVDIKFQIVEFLRNELGDEYENLKVDNSKPVVTLKFKTKNGVDKFHLDLLIVSKIDEKEFFIYSKKPLEKDGYEFVESEFRNMTDDFEEKLVTSATDDNNVKRISIRLLKFWNSNINQSSKETKIPSSVFTEKICFSENTSISSIMLETLESIQEDLEECIFESQYKPNWNYLRKLKKDDEKRLSALENVTDIIEGMTSAFSTGISTEQSITILKKYFKGIKAPVDTGAQGEATSGRAG